ncbi:MAG: hypothetical protein K0U66_06750 [Gammaproteobacteria bacterium]|nr:hypothetical protein [Gammaproteobacteria bacterium]
MNHPTDAPSAPTPSSATPDSVAPAPRPGGNSDSEKKDDENTLPRSV